MDNRRHLTIAFGIATFMIVLFAAHSYIVASFTNDTSKWMDQFLNLIVSWYLWAALFPLIHHMASHFRFAPGMRLKSALLHILAGIIISIFHATLQILFNEFVLQSGASWSRVTHLIQDYSSSTLLWRIFMYWAILAVCIALDSYRKARETEIHSSQIEGGILQAQIESLKMRLDPDFLFKSLKHLSDFMRRDLDEAETMVASLGDYLRMRMDQSGTADSTLREEIEVLKCYLEIENLKRRNTLTVEFDIDENTLECIVPGMILQAMLEDGINEQSNEAPIQLKIVARKSDSSLLLTVQRTASDIPKSSKLKQLLERLNQFYVLPFRMSKDQESVTIEIPIELYRKENRVVFAAEPSNIAEGSRVDASNPVRKWLLIIAVFTALAIYFTLHKLILFSARGVSMNWSQQLLDCTGWYIWALMTPIIWNFSSGYPLKQKGWLKYSAIHIAGFMSAWFIATVTWEGVKWAANLGEYSYLQRLPMHIARDPFSLDIICYLTIVAVESAFRYHRRFEYGRIRTVRLTTQLARARLQALKMQLHPHFLFNALNSLSELMRENSAAASEMIQNLEKFLRMTLSQVEAQEILLAEELEFLKCYLSIEHVRYQNRLSVKIDVEPRALSVLVPNLVLQPIVENAIRHAIAPRSGAGKIEIMAKSNNGTLNISVRDNGTGMKSPKKQARARSGLGLSNTRQRLIQLYGDLHRFELINAPEGGLIVALEIPVHASTA